MVDHLFFLKEKSFQTFFSYQIDIFGLPPKQHLQITYDISSYYLYFLQKRMYYTYLWWFKISLFKFKKKKLFLAFFGCCCCKNRLFNIFFVSLVKKRFIRMRKYIGYQFRASVKKRENLIHLFTWQIFQ